MTCRTLRLVVVARAAALAASLLLSFTVAAQEKLKLRVIGQPVATGAIQKNKEQPFFETLAQKTGIPLDVEYRPVELLTLKETEQLRVLKAGLFEVASLRLAQNSLAEPTVLGLDLVGLNPDYKSARAAVKAYAGILDERLQSEFNVKLLGVWPFGPQVLFCNKPLARLSALKGLKVRVYDENLAAFIKWLGGKPVVLTFGETRASLAAHAIDCAVTGASAANAAGWPEVTTHYLPLGFQMALNGYGIALDAWRKLAPEQQQALQEAFDAEIEDLWTYSEELFSDASNCNTGQDPCKTGRKFGLVNVPIMPIDFEILKKAVRDVSFPAWAEICDKPNPGCSVTWRKTLGSLVGMN